MFSQTFFYALVIVGLLWTAIGVVSLVYMLIRDWKNNDLW